MLSMLDAQNAPAAPPVEIRREAYRPPEWRVPEIALDFDLDPARTIVRARLQVAREGAHSEPLRLNAEGLELLAEKVDGAPAAYAYEDEILTAAVSCERALFETEVAIAPEAFSQLMGRY